MWLLLMLLFLISVSIHVFSFRSNRCLVLALCGASMVVLIIQQLPACLPVRLYCGPAVPVCGHTQNRRAGLQVPNGGSTGQPRPAFLSQCSCADATPCSVRVLIPAPVSVLSALGKSFLTLETCFCFVRWRQGTLLYCVFIYSGGSRLC